MVIQAGGRNTYEKSGNVLKVPYFRAPLKIPVFNAKYHHPPNEDKPMPQPGFFDLDERYAKLNERNPLSGDCTQNAVGQRN